MPTSRTAAPSFAAGSPGMAGSTDSPQVMLALATVGFLLNFWAWALLSPLGSQLRDQLALSSFQQSVLVAVPVLVGSLGRIPVGALTDRHGAQRMFPAVTVLTILPVLYLGLAADSFTEYVLGGFFLGLGGTAFAVGVPFVNAWFPPAKRGLAIGIFGMGTGGTAVSAFTTVRLGDRFGDAFPFLLVAALLALYAVVAWLVLRDLPGRSAPAGGFLARTWTTVKLPVTLQLSLLYALAFGGFVALSVYLPTYLRNAYDLTPADAANRTAGFVVLAVVMRPVGGWLSDRIHPVPVLTVCFGAAAAFAALAAAELELLPAGTIAFLGLAVALGAASGAVFALVARVAPPDKVGSVTGVVGAAGGLGGFVPPLLMGTLYGSTGQYSLGYVLLAGAAAAAAAYTWFAMRHADRG